MCLLVPLPLLSSQQTWFYKTGAPRPAFHLVCYVFVGWPFWYGLLCGRPAFRQSPRGESPLTDYMLRVPMWTWCVPSSALAATHPTHVNGEHDAVVYKITLLCGVVSSQPRESEKHRPAECTEREGLCISHLPIYSCQNSCSLPWVHSIAAKDKIIELQTSLR